VPVWKLEAIGFLGLAALGAGDPYEFNLIYANLVYLMSYEEFAVVSQLCGTRFIHPLCFVLDDSLSRFIRTAEHVTAIRCHRRSSGQPSQAEYTRQSLQHHPCLASTVPDH